MEILDQHQGRRRRRSVGQPGNQGPERLLAESESVHLRTRPPFVGVESEQGGEEGQGFPCETDISQAGSQRNEPLLRWLLRVEAEKLLEHARDGPQCDIAVIRRTVGLEHGTALEVDVRSELCSQCRLPNTGHPTDDSNRLLGPRRALGVVDQAFPRETEKAALIFAADQGHRLGQPATRWRDGQVRPHHVVQFHRASDSPERTRPDRFQLEMWFDELPGGVADDHGAGLSLTLQARRHIGGRPREGGAVDDARGQPGDHDGARMDADADGRLDAVATFQFDGCVRHPFDEPQCCQHRTPRIVLVRNGVSEARHDAVALELEHATAQLLDGLRRDPAVEGEHVLDNLRLGHFGHVGRLDDVGEDQAHEGPLASRQRTFEPRPFDHRSGAPVRRIDGQHVLSQLDHAVPRSNGRSGVHRRQKPIDQQRKAILRRCHLPFPGRRHHFRLTSRLALVHREESTGPLASRVGASRLSRRVLSDSWISSGRAGRLGGCRAARRSPPFVMQPPMGRVAPLKTLLSWGG